MAACLYFGTRHPFWPAGPILAPGVSTPLPPYPSPPQTPRIIQTSCCKVPFLPPTTYSHLSPLQPWVSLGEKNSLAVGFSFFFFWEASVFAWGLTLVYKINPSQSQSSPALSCYPHVLRSLLSPGSDSDADICSFLGFLQSKFLSSLPNCSFLTIWNVRQ